jgi:hypothetical protein
MMKKHVSIALVVALVLCVAVTYQVGFCQDSVKVTSTPSYYKFVGFSSITKTGSAGPRGMLDACTAKYGQGARMCTTQEILTSYQLPSNKPGTYGWVNPSNLNVQYRSKTDDYLAIDSPSGMTGTSSISEANAIADLNCDRWTVASENCYGLVIWGAQGSFWKATCNSSNPVACCNR